MKKLVKRKYKTKKTRKKQKRKIPKGSPEYISRTVPERTVKARTVFRFASKTRKIRMTMIKLNWKGSLASGPNRAICRDRMMIRKIKILSHLGQFLRNNDQNITEVVKRNDRLQYGGLKNFAFHLVDAFHLGDEKILGNITFQA